MRSKVTFEDENCDLLDELPQILKSKDSARYQKLLIQLKDALDTSIDLSLKCLKIAGSNVSLLTPNYSELVHLLLKIDWLTSDSTKLIDAYRNFIENLVSAHSNYTASVAKSLISRFTYSGSSEAMSSRIHTTLHNILHIIPSSTSIFMPIITQNFPHKRDSQVSHTTYLKNLLALMNYAPILRQQILELIMDRLLQIDVEIQVELDELDDEICEKVHDVMFNSDSDHSDSEDEESEDEIDSIVAINIKEMVEKLDMMLSMLMEYMVSIQEAHRDNPEGLMDLLHPLLEIFQKQLLTTHRSRYTQFLWFYVCSTDPGFADTFLGLLVSTAFQSKHTQIRIAAVSYIASYMARAKYLDLSQVKTCIKVLNSWCLNYISSHSPSQNWKNHALFYTTVQALLYVFCFRWRELLTDADCDVTFGKFPKEMDGFKSVIMSKFRPLQYCSQAIVEEFSKITHRLEIIYCYTYMTRTTTKDLLEDTTLDAFFPFDPLSLKRSCEYVEDLYQVWESVEDDDEDEENNETQVHEDVLTDHSFIGAINQMDEMEYIY